MKNILLLLFLFPISLFAKKKEYANPCDSMSNIIYLKEQNRNTIVDNVNLALKTYTTANHNELFKVEKVNDSTLISIGIFQIKKVSLTTDETFGFYNIKPQTDGFISYSLIIEVKTGKLRYEFINLKHYGCRYEMGKLCAGGDDNLLKNSLKIQFLKRATDITDLLKIENFKKSEW